MTADGDEVVLATKLFPPRARDAVVLRERLLTRLRLGLDRPLTLAVAPAGWGKSTLVGDWLRQDGIQAGWVSLDPADDDDHRFWRYLLLAAIRAGDGVGREALRRLDAARSDVLREVVPTFVNEVVAAGTRLVVVLDDYHVIVGRRVHDGIGLLLDHCPENLHLVLVTRADPPLPLSRLRVRGQLVELRAQHLRFSASEAGELLNGRLGLGLADRDVDRLLARTEGWAAGLHLAALRLRETCDAEAFIDAFTGADRQVVDYLGGEVLDAQPPALREFLLETSVLGRFCAPLCDAVTGTGEAGQLLTGVLRANLFVIPLDDEARWFRYHHLFGGLLRHELTRASPERAATLLQRAAQWHAAHGDAGEAIEYALEAGAAHLAGGLVAAHWRSHFNAGELDTVQRWLSALPADHVAAEPSLSVGQVWIALDSGRLTEAVTAVDAAEAAGADDVHLRVLRALLLYKVGDLTGAGARLAAVRPGPDTEPFVRTVWALISGLVALWAGDGASAQRWLTLAATVAVDDGNRLAQIYSAGCRALLALNRGDRAGAVQLIEDGDRCVAESMGDAHFIAMFPALARARLALHDGEREAARRSAGRALELARRGAARGELAAALLTSALADQDGGTAADRSRAQARAWITEARAVLRECPEPGAVLAAWLAGQQRSVPHSGGALPEELTDRELAVLRLLPGTASRRELAASLFVSPNTLKTHLGALYRKLGAQSRADAVLRAREQGLL